MKLTFYVYTHLFLMLCFTNKSIAQKQGAEKIDSLSESLRNYKSACNTPCITDSSKVRILLELGKEHIFKNPDSSYFYASEALRLATQLKWQTGIYSSYHSLGYYFARIGEYDSSKNYYLKALEVADQIAINGATEEKKAIKFSKSKTLGNAGTIFIDQGDISTGLDFYFMSLKIEEELQNQAGISKDLILIGRAFDAQGQPQKALEYYLKAESIEKKLNNFDRLSSVLGNIGVVYSHSGDDNKALYYYTEALKAAESLGDPSRIGGLLTDIAEIYSKKSDYVHAKENLLKGLSLSRSIDDKYSITSILTDLGFLYMATKEYAKSEKNFKDALALTAFTNDKEGMQIINDGLSQLYIKQGNYKEAIEYYRKAMLLKDTLYNETKDKQIAQKEMTYQFEKKQDSIKIVQDKKDVLTKQEIEKQKLIRNSIIGGSSALVLIGFLAFINFRNKRKKEKAELSLQVSETEMKALRSQMNPHFIFNALQSIQTFLLSHQSEEANTYLLKFSALMRLVLENSRHAEVPVRKDFEALELYMQLERLRLQYPFTYKIKIDENIDAEDVTIPPLILQPFIENAVWHGLQYKSERGHIDIKLTRQNEYTFCTVKDDGVGRSYAEKLQPHNLENNRSLGLKITEERLSVLNELQHTTASFQITDLFDDNNKPAGTLITLKLPYHAND